MLTYVYGPHIYWQYKPISTSSTATGLLSPGTPSNITPALEVIRRARYLVAGGTVVVEDARAVRNVGCVSGGGVQCSADDH